MRPGTATLLAKADRAAAAADAALASGAPETAAGRAFYAMLYAAKALLNERGLRLRTHQRIVAALAQVAADRDPPLQAWLATALARRRAGETNELTYEEAGALAERARQAVAAARRDIA